MGRHKRLAWKHCVWSPDSKDYYFRTRSRAKRKAYSIGVGSEIQSTYIFKYRGIKSRWGNDRTVVDDNTVIYKVIRREKAKYKRLYR